MNDNPSPPPSSPRPAASKRSASPPARRRTLPRRFKIGLAVGAALLLVVVVANRHSSGKKEAAPRLEIQDDMVVSEEDLHNRHQVEAHDFHPRERYAPANADRAPTAPPSAVHPAGTGANRPADVDELAERRARRSADPEDLISRRGRAKTRPAADDEDGGAAGNDERPLYLEPKTMVVRGESRGTANANGKGTGRPLVAAGETIAAVLAAPLELQGRSTTVVAIVDGDGPLPQGARFIGTASASGDRVVMRFRTLSLPTGDEIRVSAQAQDEDGSFGVLASVSGDPSEPSVERDVATDTATDVGTDLMGGGILGRAAGDYVRGSERRSRRRTAGVRPTLSLSAGTPVRVFMEEAARSRN